MLPEIEFRVAEREDYSPLTLWLVVLGQTPAQHCLHTWSGQTAEALREQWLAYWEASELCYVLAWQAGRLVGAMGSEYDVELGRAWLHGPHAITDDWDGLADELFRRLRAALPGGLRQWEAYLNVENRRGRQFYARHGFEARESLSYDFWLAPEDRVGSGGGGCEPLGPQHVASFRALFEALFPTAYYSAARIVQMLGQSHQVFVVAEGEAVLGFAVASLEDPSAGEIQFLGVHEDARRQGLGRRLLRAAADWLLDEAGVDRVCLNVGAEQVPARRLYESAGFRLQFTGIGLQKTDAG